MLSLVNQSRNLSLVTIAIVSVDLTTKVSGCGMPSIGVT